MSENKFNTSGTNLSVGSNGSTDRPLKKQRKQSNLNSTHTAVRAHRIGKSSLAIQFKTRNIETAGVSFPDTGKHRKMQSINVTLPVNNSPVLL